MTTLTPAQWQEIFKDFRRRMRRTTSLKERQNLNYTPDFNLRLDWEIQHAKFSKDRYWAWIMRMSWGNWNEYCCVRSTETGELENTLYQAHAAKAVSVTPKSISRLTALWIAEGRLQSDSEGRIIPVLERGEIVVIDDPTTESKWKAAEQRWRVEFPERAKELDDARAVVKEIRAELRVYYRESERSGAAAPSDADGTGSGNENSPAPVTNTPPDGTGSGNENSPAPVTPKTPASHGHDIDPRAHASLNSKQFSDEASSSSSAVSSPSEDFSIPSSVGRSLGVEPKTTTDRTIGESDSPFKPKIREWMASHLKVPGFDLEEPELEEIAATIQTEQHFTQFQTAAKRQKDPRGWKVYVKIAVQCQKRRNQYAKAAGAGGETDDWMSGKKSRREVFEEFMASDDPDKTED